MTDKENPVALAGADRVGISQEQLWDNTATDANLQRVARALSRRHLVRLPVALVIAAELLGAQPP